MRDPSPGRRRRRSSGPAPGFTRRPPPVSSIPFVSCTSAYATNPLSHVFAEPVHPQIPRRNGKVALSMSIGRTHPGKIRANVVAAVPQADSEAGVARPSSSSRSPFTSGHDRGAVAETQTGTPYRTRSDDPRGQRRQRLQRSGETRETVILKLVTCWYSREIEGCEADAVRPHRPEESPGRSSDN